MVIGFGLAMLLILLPRAIEGDYYEVTDPLVFMGVPLVVMGAAVGALLGARGPHAVTGDVTTPGESTSGRIIVVVVATSAGILACWLFLWAIGAVEAAPLWLW